MSAEHSGAAAAVLAAAAQVVRAVALDGRSFASALQRAQLAVALRPAVQAVALGTIRWYLQLEPLVERLLSGKALVPVLRALLMAALHQLEHSRNPPEATVSSAVDAARVLKQPRAAAMINALLRRYLREREALLQWALQRSEGASAHPLWLLEALQADYPAHWQQIVAANNTHPPMTLRVDLSRTTRAAYLERLGQAGLTARPVSWSRTALLLERARPVAQLPEFDRGLVSVQDAGAQLAAELLGPLPGERVLDACAAPGGKSGGLLEAAGGPLDLTAIDIDETRIELIAQNLRRLERTAHLVAADLCAEPCWWNGERFDRILLDAPCSSTGVIRRHPDIKLLRRAGDVAAFAATQRQLLGRCIAMLRPGGRLLYSTCSLLSAENEQPVAAVLASHPEVRALPLEDAVAGAPWLSRGVGMQLLPGDKAETDGFYYACLTVT